MVDAGILHALLSGIVTGSYIALGAIGLGLVYNISKVPNFAHGELLMVGAYFAVLVNIPWRDNLPPFNRLTSGPNDITVPLMLIFFVLTFISFLSVLYLIGGRTALEGGLWPIDIDPRVGLLTHLVVASLVAGYVALSIPSLFAGFVFAVIVMAAVTPLLDKLIFEHFRERDAELVTMLIVTMGLAFFIRYTAQAYYTGSVRQYQFSGELSIGGITIDYLSSRALNFFLVDNGIILEIADRSTDPATTMGVFSYGWLAILAIVAATAIIGYAAYRWRGAGIGELESAQTIGPLLVGGFVGVIVFFGLSVILPGTTSIPDNYVMATQIRTSYLRVGIIVLAVALMLFLHLLLRETKLGKAMRASADNLDLAEVTGIDTNKVMMTTWIIAGAFAAIAGVTVGMLLQGLRPLMGFFLLLPMFAAVILGGLSSIYGAIIGSYAVGIAMEVGLLTFRLSGVHRVTIAFIVLLVVLLVKPEGIIGGR